MGSVRRLAMVAGTIVAGLLYVWFAAVRAVPEIKRRKAARRARRAT